MRTILGDLESEWDVAVIGAGPAGSIAAMQLAGRGSKVLLLERKEFPRPKVCGGCLNARALETLRGLGLERLVEESSAAKVDRLELRAVGQRIELPIPAGVAICRSQLDEKLAQTAEERGARLITGVTARVVSSLTNSVTDAASHELHLESAGEPVQTVWAKIVVLAGGLQSASCVSPKLLATKVASASRIGAGAVLTDTTESFLASTICMSVTDFGYAGAVQLADGRQIIAAALDREFIHRTASVASAVEEIFSANGWNPFAAGQPPAFQGTPPLTRALARPAADRLFVIGDAAGYVEPFTGEGMASAIATGVAVTPFVMRGVEQWKPNLADEWVRFHRHLTQPGQAWCRGFAALLRHRWLTRFAAAVPAHWPALPAWVARRVVGQSSPVVEQCFANAGDPALL